MLREEEIVQIQDQVRDKLVQISKQSDVIGSQIFSILERESKVLYYPIDNVNIWGFSEKHRDIQFVCINTSLTYDRQVFAAAHELYHIWYDPRNELTKSKNITKEEDIHIELLANRFSAEFLMEERLLKSEIQAYCMEPYSLGLRDVIRLANLFSVPYRAILKRLVEIGLMTADKYEELHSITDEEVDRWRIRLGLEIPESDRRIRLSNLVDLAMDAYDKHLITQEHLKYDLELADLSLDAMGVKQIQGYVFPTDEELDAIMEE